MRPASKDLRDARRTRTSEDALANKDFRDALASQGLPGRAGEQGLPGCVGEQGFPGCARQQGLLAMPSPTGTSGMRSRTRISEIRSGQQGLPGCVGEQGFRETPPPTRISRDALANQYFPPGHALSRGVGRVDGGGEYRRPCGTPRHPVFARRPRPSMRPPSFLSLSSLVLLLGAFVTPASSPAQPSSRRTTSG